MMSIIALNLTPPYDDKTLTPFEEMHAFVSPENGIPMTEDTEKELIERKWLSDKIQKMEMKNQDYEKMEESNINWMDSSFGPSANEEQ